mmetsp:Transcript_64861/g.204851  ORF Transcript_64861/g.204851 Transcript_64861/m.204851 type:complete len:175 (-) Transcript_64861:145-669(-)|eukprot:CAMPEP_0182908174 /NCGR_PEP_ID=MMETSP0034_2-20130328/35051_1 /TAXON_ID=156128 /ORGANISM="Nephroselmis pyriformis, Strain CCMP717" /LENGTH=174 /DNA_ID=CAMNT_0025044313 /DNA_START=172 /DNA_END=696 /DNA_ORIENTATION=-
MTNGRKIAVCVDDSMHSEKAWLWAIGNFLRPDDQVTLITVASPTADDLAGVGSQFTTDPLFHSAEIDTDVDRTKRLWNNTRKHAMALLDNFKALAEEANVPFTVSIEVINGGCVGEGMVGHINKARFHVAILGSRGMGTVKRGLMDLVGMGSISDYCVHNLHCPVVVVKPDQVC